MRVYPWIPIIVFSRLIKIIYKHELRVGETSTNSRIHPALKLLHLQNLWYRPTMRTKYGCNKIQSTEICYLLAWWCQQKKEFSHITDIVVVIRANPASSATSKTSFSAAGRVIGDRRTHLRPNTSWLYPFLNSTVTKYTFKPQIKCRVWLLKPYCWVCWRMFTKIIYLLECLVRCSNS